MLRNAHRMRALGLRALSAAAATAPHKAGTVGEILASASAAAPLKDAVKFYRGEEATIWSYADLHKNVSAVASGLQKLRYGVGDCIVSCIPTGTPEHTSLVLAASQVGFTVVTVPSASDASATADALRKHSARMLVLDSDTQSILESLKIDAATCETGRPLISAEFPALEHVVHTGSGESRSAGAMAFRSLLAYNNQAQHVNTEQPLLVQSDTNSAITTQQVLQDANSIGEKLELTSDHLSTNGKLIITPSYDNKMPAGILAALMHEALCITPVENDTASKLAESENAIVLQ